MTGLLENLVASARIGRPRCRSGIAAVLLVASIAAPLVSAAVPARAQEADASRAAALRKVAQTCRPYTERFCPELLAAGTPSSRAQVLCLKHYKVSLSLNCRAAVSTASR